MSDLSMMAITRMAGLATAPGWRLIETAPPWFNDDYQALVGQLNTEGRWVKVELWMPAWNRDGMINRGATHWLRLPEPPNP